MAHSFSSHFVPFASVSIFMLFVFNVHNFTWYKNKHNANLFIPTPYFSVDALFSPIKISFPGVISLLERCFFVPSSCVFFFFSISLSFEAPLFLVICVCVCVHAHAVHSPHHALCIDPLYSLCYLMPVV